MQFLPDARSSEPLNIVLCLTQQSRNNARVKGARAPIQIQCWVKKLPGEENNIFSAKCLDAAVQGRRFLLNPHLKAEAVDPNFKNK